MATGNLSDEKLVQIIASIFSFLSTCCSLYLVGIILGIWYFPRKKHTTKPLVIYVHVFWMSVCDIVWGAIMFHQFGVGDLFELDEESNLQCVFLGNLAIFFQLASTSWYFMICWILYLSLTETTIASLTKKTWIQHLFVWTLSALVVTIGNATENIGKVYMGDHVYNHCFLLGPSLFLFYGPVLCYMLFALFVFVKCWFYFRGLEERSLVMQKVLAYVFIFILVWILPVLFSLLKLFDIEPNFFALIYSFGMSAGGFANFCVWMSSDSFDKGDNLVKKDSWDLYESENSRTTVTVYENQVDSMEKIGVMFDCRKDLKQQIQQRHWKAKTTGEKDRSDRISIPSFENGKEYHAFVRRFE